QEHKLGKVPLDDDTVVVPVPDTGKAAADAMAFELGVPSVEGLMRNRYVGRTFIEGGSNRADRARMKYTPLRQVLDGKPALLIDAVARSIGLQGTSPCRACLTGEYPTPTGERLYQLALLTRHNGERNGRTYERPPANGHARS